MSAPPQPIAIIAGVGPGIGASIARRFAKKYPVVLLSRKPSSYQTVETEINDNGGRALGIRTDVSDSGSLKDAFERVREEFPGSACAVAVFNATGPFLVKSVLEITEEEMERGVGVGIKGALLFSQHVLPLLLEHTGHPPTLLFTGATASLRSSALFAAFSVPKFGMRSLAQSIAREFAPKGVHVAHVVLDGPVDVPSEEMQKFLRMKGEGEKIDPAEVAETYWWLHCQGKRGWSFEVDLRGFGEKW